MSKTLTFYYDYLSPYTYLAYTQLQSKLRSKIDTIHYVPIEVLTVMEKVNNSPTTMLSEAKGQYAMQDLARWANRYQVPFARNPHFGTFGPQALCLAAISAQKSGQIDACNNALFQAMWVDGVNFSDPDALLKVLNQAGIKNAEQLLQHSQSDEIAQALHSNNEMAVQAGVFGSPSFKVGNELFFGNDRLDFVEDALSA